MAKLITDIMPLLFKLEESETVGGVRKLRGLFHLAETQNANGRVYSKALLEREVGRIMPSIKDRRVLGELDHPDDPRIHLDKSSHVITNLKVDGIKIFGELEALKTPCGRILEGLIDSGVKLGISSRGLGSLKENDEGIKVVQEDYSLITWDVVPNPSTPEAWLGEAEQIMNYSQYFNEKTEKSEETTENLEENEKNQEVDKINTELMIERINNLFGGK